MVWGSTSKEEINLALFKNRKSIRSGIYFFKSWRGKNLSNPIPVDEISANEAQELHVQGFCYLGALYSEGDLMLLSKYYPGGKVETLYTNMKR